LIVDIPGIEHVAHGMVVGADLGIDLLVQMVTADPATAVMVVSRHPLTHPSTLLAGAC
jgi:hypothetical protein